MADTFGLLELPVPIPSSDDDALGDPALDLVLAFCKAVLNADLGTAWAARSPADPLPVAYTFAHNPDLESFNANETPALYMWRADDSGVVHKMTQDLVADEAGLQALWVPPPMPQESKRAREAIRNAFKKSLRAALAQGRHPAWVVDGDTYFEPEDYGSVLLHHTKFGKCRLGQFKNHTLIIESEDRAVKTSFECLFFTLETLETFTFDPSGREAYPTLNNAQGTVALPEREEQTESLAALSYTLDPTLTGLDVVTGPEEGGTVVTISGQQFADDDPNLAIEVYFGANQVDPDDVELVDESTLTVVAPAGTGVVDVIVTFPSGVSKTLAGAFTYT